MNPLTRLVEAALFSAAHPLTVGELRALDPEASTADIEQALTELRERYDAHGHAVEVVHLAQGYQILTRPEMAESVARARIVSRPRRLSTAALETLAVIAYRQPVGRAEIEEIRGVAADGVLRSLQERGLIEVAGRSEGLGRPLLYGTTNRFLEMIGIQELEELPRLDELAVALRPLEQAEEAAPPEAGRPEAGVPEREPAGGEGAEEDAGPEPRENPVSHDAERVGAGES